MWEITICCLKHLSGKVDGKWCHICRCNCFQNIVEIDQFFGIPLTRLRLSFHSRSFQDAWTQLHFLDTISDQLNISTMPLATRCARSTNILLMCLQFGQWTIRTVWPGKWFVRFVAFLWTVVINAIKHFLKRTGQL